MTLESYQPKPQWLKVRPPAGENFVRLRQLFRRHNLHTVCEEALCPNVAECWGRGTATIMLLGNVCTRSCRFCDVSTGKPNGFVNSEEPVDVAAAVAQMGLSYVVLTSVDRDDLPDGGANHFAQTVEEIKKKSPKTLVEVLIPDFAGSETALGRVANCGADVVGHNIETVRRLSPVIRDRRSGYEQSLEVLKTLKESRPSVFTKSSIMVGLGERDEEVLGAMDDLRAVRVDILTVGQYLRPSHKQVQVKEYVRPEKFKEFEAKGLEKGFLAVSSGPLVRSSYRAAEEFLEKALRS